MMGWCQAGSSGESCDQQSCDQIGGDYSPTQPRGICLVLSILEDPTARRVIRSLIYPPILRVRDEILPTSPLGKVIVRDFRRHYSEATDILRADPDLLGEVIDFLTAAVPFARSLTGDLPPEIIIPPGDTPSSYTARRLRPGLVDWMSQLLERIRSAAGEELGSTIERYQRLLPELTDLSPREFLVAMRRQALVEIVDTPSAV